MFRKSIIAIACFCAMFAASQAQQGPYKFDLQKPYRYLSTSTTEMLQEFGGQSFNMSTETRLYTHFVASELLPDGSFHIAQTLDSTRISVESPMGTQKAGQETDGKKVSFIMRPDGKVVFRDSSDASDKVAAASLNSNSNAGTFALLSGADFTRGKSWEAVTVDTVSRGEDPMITTRKTTYTVKGTKTVAGRECSEVAFQSTSSMHGAMEQQGMKLAMQMEGTDSGTLYFDVKAGMMIEITTKGTADMNISVAGSDMGAGTSSITTNSVTRYIAD
jgi:hypothetical protein